MNFVQYIPFTEEYNVKYSMWFIKHIFNSDPFTIEKYTHYKQFKNKVMNKTFTSKMECEELANKISPALGFTRCVGTIEDYLNLK